MPAVLVSAAARVPVAVPVMMPAAAAVLMMLVPFAFAVLTATLMPVLVTAALAVLMLMFVLVLVTAALAVLMLMLVMFAHKNLRKKQWLFKCSTIRSKENVRLFAQMIEPEIQDLLDVLVGKGIEHVLPFTAKPDEVT